MGQVINLQQVLESLAASGADTDALLTAVGELSSVPAGGFNTPVNTLYTLESANGTPLANVINISRQAAESAEQVGNSNLAGAAGTFTSGAGASAAAGQQAGASTFTGGATKFLNGTAVGKILTGVGTVAAPIAAVAVGAQLGKTIDSAAYSIGTEIGKLFGFEMADSLNPETWNSITYDMADTGLEGVYKRGLQMLLGLNQDTNELEAYIQKDAFDYLAYVLAQAGYFDSADYSGRISTIPSMTSTQQTYFNSLIQPVNFSPPTSLKILTKEPSQPSGNQNEYTVQSATGSGTIYGFLIQHGASLNVYNMVLVSNQPFSVTYINRRVKPSEVINTYTGNSSQASLINGQQYHYYSVNTSADPALTEGGVCTITQTGISSTAYAVIAYILFNGTISGGTSVDGVGDQTGATIPPINSSSSQQDVADAISTTFPNLEGNKVEMPVAVPANVPKPVTYVQVPLPSTVAGNNPTVEPTATPQADPNIDPQTATDPLQALLLKLLTGREVLTMPDPANNPEEYPEGKPEEPPNTNPPDVGTGGTPTLVVPVGSASALWAVYNPTQAEIESLGAWLWSNNFVDQLLKMFNDPMQAIIGLHKTFIPPITGAAQNIKVGYLDSGVSSLTIPTQYSSVDCGTIDCAEYFGNVFDYSPYTKIYLYLPFIGFKELDVAQVMRSRIKVTYHGDAFTGACLAEVSVNRDGGAGGVLYSFSGDCAARYPLSHGSYMGIVNAIAGIGIGIGTALAGAPSIGIAGAVGMAQHARANVEHSGSFTGNSGAMGIKKPYLVILRPQSAMANNYEHFTGQPSNSNIVLGSASGYVRVKECHVEDISTATDAEKQMIESALKTGVII